MDKRTTIAAMVLQELVKDHHYTTRAERVKVAIKYADKLMRELDKTKTSKTKQND